MKNIYKIIKIRGIKKAKSIVKLIGLKNIIKLRNADNIRDFIKIVGIKNLLQ